MTPVPADLSVTVVNYNSAAYVARLLDSLFADRFTVGDRPGVLEVVIVDNASRDEDHLLLESLRRPGVRLVRNTENVGYALANNQGFHVARGRWHVVSNPDVLVVPGCLAALIDAVETLPDAGIVGPLGTIDRDGQVFLPPNELPDNFLEAVTGLSRYLAPVARYNIRRRARFAHRYWQAREPLALPMLSGSFFLGRRATFATHGLFDPAYPLYYEDTDLFRRYHQQGLKLWHVPRARIVHHFSRSALPRMKAALYRNQIGVRRYFRQHFGDAGYRTYRAFADRAARLARDGDCPCTLVEIPATADPPVLPMPGGDGTYLEVAGNPKYSLTVGLFPGRPGPYRLPDGFWAELACTHYWARAVDPATGETLIAWRLTKCPKNP